MSGFFIDEFLGWFVAVRRVLVGEFAVSLKLGPEESSEETPSARLR